MPLLEVRGLEKWYGRRQVVNGVDYDVAQGEVVGLLGPNGAGKTTSFRMTIGLIDADGGKVKFDGRDVTTGHVSAGAGRNGIPRPGFERFPAALRRGQPDGDPRDPPQPQQANSERLGRTSCLDQFGLTKIRKTKANRVSGGERRRLEIARSLITEPKLIMLDEPFAGIDPKTVAEIQDQIRALVETYNMGILLTDHQFRETIEVTDRSYLIREGRVFAYGNREQIVNNPEVRRHYIGERFDVGHILEKRRPVAITQAAGRAESQEASTVPKPAELPDLSTRQIIIGDIALPHSISPPIQAAQPEFGYDDDDPFATLEQAD